jgi:tyrosine-protein kinase Etk/Wzc
MKKQRMTFWDFFKLLVKWKNSLLLNIIIVGTLSVVVSLYLPKWYKATAVVMPPQKESGAGFSALLSNLPISSLGINLGGGDQMTYMAILKSRSLATDVIKKFNLKKFYKKKTMEKTLLNFYSDYDVMVTEENMISISYEYTDSVKVAEIINYIVKKLSEVSKKLVLQRAKENYKIVERRYLQNLRDLDSLQTAMEIFQKKYGVMEFFEQTKSIMNAIADLEAKILLKKAELEAVRKSYGKKSPQYKSGLIQLNSLTEQVNKLKYSNKEKLKNPFSSVFIPLNKLPELGKRYTELYSNLLMQQKLREYILPEYEQAKIQLAKKEPVLQIIDYAVPPDYKSKPKRAFIVLGALFVALLIHFSIILFVEKLRWLEENDAERYDEVITTLKSIFRIKK